MVWTEKAIHRLLKTHDTQTGVLLGSVAIEFHRECCYRKQLVMKLNCTEMGSKFRGHGCLCGHRDFINCIQCNCKAEYSNKEMKLPLSLESKEYWSIFTQRANFARSQERPCSYKQLRAVIRKVLYKCETSVKIPFPKYRRAFPKYRRAFILGLTMQVEVLPTWWELQIYKY